MKDSIENLVILLGEYRDYRNGKDMLLEGFLDWLISIHNINRKDYRNQIKKELREIKESA